MSKSRHQDRSDCNVRIFRTKFLQNLPSTLVRRGVLAGVMLLTSAAAHAVPIPITIDFSDGTLGLLSSTLTTPEGVVVDGLYFDELGSGDWEPGSLFRRDETNDHGLGVCNPEETCSAPGGGDINELDNAGREELIRLTLPEGFRWVSVRLSSLDDNGSDIDDLVERGQLFADEDGDPANGLGTLFRMFEGGDGNPIEPTFVVPTAQQFVKYVFFQPYDWENNGSNTNNDFLVWKSTIVRRLPEPGTLGLLAAGLLGLALARRPKGIG